MGIHQLIKILRSPFSRGESPKPLQIGPPTNFRKEELVFPIQYEKDTGNPIEITSSGYTVKTGRSTAIKDECLSPRRFIGVSR